MLRSMTARRASYDHFMGRRRRKRRSSARGRHRRRVQSFSRFPNVFEQIAEIGEATVAQQPRGRLFQRRMRMRWSRSRRDRGRRGKQEWWARSRRNFGHLKHKRLDAASFHNLLTLIMGPRIERGDLGGVERSLQFGEGKKGVKIVLPGYRMGSP